MNRERVVSQVVLSSENEPYRAVKVWCNFPIKYLQELDDQDINSVSQFLGRIIVGWEGFGDLECKPENMGELTIDEVREMVPRILEHILHPQKRNKVSI